MRTTRAKFFPPHEMCGILWGGPIVADPFGVFPNPRESETFTTNASEQIPIGVVVGEGENRPSRPHTISGPSDKAAKPITRRR